MSGTTPKKVFIRSFGCQMNDYDSARMADLLRDSEGYEPTGSEVLREMIWPIVSEPPVLAPARNTMP